ncbi:hypothetical protein [Pigmentiphaga litoralis]|uniref:Uncharacterized protein n=1 Tax=Pigmentiphaga litoralis TaxID=516702 RepID=A0A7Y9IZS0_9BURK|nr:hypothetical protein [Pigmentiphaga litoralis]NYE26540.1 hypothetical protein [Pigmentiphaga litoralis]NYE86049.1 hypothetical protein [Pigmentiphaga litoralis]
MIQRIDMLKSEINELQQMLNDLDDSAVIQRLSLQGRLNAAQGELERVEATPEPLRARLTFRGRPVFGSHGIAADFGGKASNAFADAFAAVVAGLNENLQFMGPIPDRVKNQLLITGTAQGSFGFVFELPPAAGLFPEHERTGDALATIQSLFEASAQGSDDEVAELVEAIHPRAVKKVFEFLCLLSQYHALCGLEFKDKTFRFEGTEQLERSAGRLAEGNIQEKKETHRGMFLGVLPNSRSFEFQTANGVIKGKIGTAIEDPDIINREWLRQESCITLGVIQVGQGRPRYTLIGLPE